MESSRVEHVSAYARRLIEELRHRDRRAAAILLEEDLRARERSGEWIGFRRIVEKTEEGLYGTTVQSAYQREA